MGEADAASLAFGPYRLDPQARRLTRDGAEIALGGRAFDLLATLVAAGGETRSKDALLEAVWSGMIVEENNLQVQVSALRKLLGDGWIVTVPGRGYRLVQALPTPPPTIISASPTLPDLPSIAVLPFANVGGEAEQEYFSDGIAEDILTALSRDRRLFLIGRATSFTYRGPVDLRQVGRDLGVRYVLDGTVRRGGDRLRITVRLNDATTGAALWSDRHDRGVADMFAVQDEITAAVTAAVGLAVVEAEQTRARRKPPSDLSVWESYQRAQWHLAKHTEQQAQIAIDYFRRATMIDPHFAPAHAGWAFAIGQLAAVHGALPLAEAGRRMDALARRAIDYEPDDADGYVALANALLVTGDTKAAAQANAVALRLSPSWPRAIAIQGLLLIWQGAREEGRRLVSAYLRRDPRDSGKGMVTPNVSWSHYQDGNYAAVIDMALDAIGAGSASAWPYRHLAAAYGQLGRLTEARQALDVLIANWPGHVDVYVRARPPFHRPEVHARILEGLRKAGWDGT